jgi:aldehyde:ferredoxin oxidoreductase
MGKVLRVDLSQLRATVEELPAAWDGYGGRALTSTIVATEVPPTCDPLGPHNKLVFAPGLLAGTPAANGGRLSAGAKSPLTGGIKESSSGGTAGPMLARLGIRALVLEGQPKGDAWYHLHVSKDGVTFHEEKELVGKGNFTVLDVLEARLGKKFGSLSIGPAGEQRMCAASISVRDLSGKLRCHGRGGMGAVMGSKRIKVISIDESGASGVPIAEPEKFTQAAKVWAKAIIAHPGIAHGMRPLGTSMLVNIISGVGAAPTCNFRYGQFPQHDKISGETMRETILARGGSPTHPCQPGCIIQCSQVYNDKDGKYLTSGFEYETLGLLGANCEIDDLDKIAQADHLLDDIGLDSIDTACAIAIAMEAGVLSFGDADAMLRVIRDEIGRATSLGRVLGAGAATAAKIFGVTRSATAKSQAFPAYDPRSIKGIGITYATSPMGADHTAGYAVGPTIAGHIDGHKKEGQIELSRFVQITSSALDAYGLCTFTDMVLGDMPESRVVLVDMVNALHGTNWTADECMGALGKYILKTERQFNIDAGLTSQDRLPEFLSREPLPPHNTVWDFTEEEIATFWNF